jgi:type IV pilus assembly protein PilN
MRVRLNLATKPSETHRRFLTASSVGSFAALVVFLALGWHVYSARKANADYRAREQAIRVRLADLETERSRLRAFFEQPENAKLHDRAVFINSFLDERSFNWTQMFMDLEHILPQGVRIVSIEPQQKEGRIEVKFRVGALNDDAKLKFLRALEDSHQFTHIALLKDAYSREGSSGDPDVLELTAEYLRL